MFGLRKECLNMLNEGYTLYKSLERCGIKLTKRHPDIQEPGKKDGLIVGLNKDGKVDRIEYRKRDDISKLWTTGKGNHNRFPVLKLQKPVWKVGKDDPLRKNLINLKKDETEKRKLLITENRQLYFTELENLWDRLKKRVSTLKPFFETTTKDYMALPELMNRFLLTQVNHFIEDLLTILKSTQNDIPYSLLDNVLIGNKWNNKKQEFITEIPLILDVSEWESFSIRVASPKFENFVSECLFKMQDDLTNQTNNIKGLSAISGQVTTLEDDKFPNPKLPVIGNTYLFSVNEKTPCQTRYKKTSTEIIPIGRKEANAIQDSLNWITENSREGKTWYPVPGIMDKRDLLIAYIENKPDINVNKAYLLGGVSQNDFSESHYEATAKVVIDALKGGKIVKANDIIRIFVLRKADPGRTQVSLQRVHSISELMKADEQWREAAKNFPPFSLPFFKKEIERKTANQPNISESISNFLNNNESNTILLSPWCPYPADLVQLTQKQWIRFGQETSAVPAVSLGDVYEVFFDLQNKQKHLTEGLLNLTLQRIQSLLIGLGNADHKNEITIFYTDTRFTVLKAITILSIYLYKIGIKKENYMKDTFFYIGKFLSLIDTLHYEYCKNVRDGSIPPQLLGNAHLQIALDNPVSALDILSRRIGIYQAWTKKEKVEQAKLGRWAVRELGEVSGLLAEKTLPTTTTSTERVQILLGYLARPEKKFEKDVPVTAEIES